MILFNIWYIYNIYSILVLLLPFYIFTGMYPFRLHIVIQSKVKPISRVQTKKTSHVNEEIFNYEVNKMSRMSEPLQPEAKSCKVV